MSKTIATIDALVPRAITMPALYSTEDQRDPIVWVRLFHPLSEATWLLIEIDRRSGTAFSYCSMFAGCGELGYVDLGELAAYRGPLGFAIKRDAIFKPKPPSEARLQCNV